MQGETLRAGLDEVIDRPSARNFSQFLRVVLEHRVDLVEEIVDVFLQLLAALGRRGRFLDDLFSRSWAPVSVSVPVPASDPPRATQAARRAGGASYFREQPLHVLLATTRRLHHRDPSRWVASDVSTRLSPSPHKSGRTATGHCHGNTPTFISSSPPSPCFCLLARRLHTI